MDEHTKQLITMLNDMYYSQGDEYKSRYRDNYFELLQHIISPSAHVSGEEIIAYVNSASRLFEDRTKQEDSE